MTIATQTMAVYWWNINGKFNGYEAFDTELTGGEAITIPGAGNESEYVKNSNRSPVILHTAATTPSGQPNFTLQIVETLQQDALYLAKQQGRKISVQLRIQPHGSLIARPDGEKFTI